MNRYSNGNGINGHQPARHMGFQPRQREHEPLSKTNVFIRGLSVTTNDDDLYNMCSKFGSIVSSKSILNRATNECKGYGFVNFENPDDAALAVRELTNCGYQARMSRENSGRSPAFGQRVPTDYRRNGGTNGISPRYNANGNMMQQLSKTNVYLRGLDSNTSDDDLHQLCNRYGNILSVKAIIDRNTNVCKGYGFVNFDSPYSAEQAISDLQSKGFHAQMSRENRGPRQTILAGVPSWQ